MTETLNRGVVVVDLELGSIQVEQYVLGIGKKGCRGVC